MSQELKPCPFCGKGNTAKLVPASDFLADEDDDYGYTHSETFAVICDASAPGGPGGCGGSGGFKPTEAQAIAAWNTRTQQPEQVVPEDVRRDAERYRWLRAKENQDNDAWNTFGPYSGAQEVDAAIDAAMLAASDVKGE